MSYEVQQKVVDPTDEDETWTQVSVPDTLSTARDHARKQAAYVGTARVINRDTGEELERYERDISKRAGARKVKVLA